MEMELDPTNAPAPKRAPRIRQHNYDRFWRITSLDRVRCIDFVDGLIKEPECRTEFQSSFINYCYRQIRRLGRPDTKWDKYDTQEMAERILAVMSKEPTELEEFKALLVMYKEGSWSMGTTKGLAPTEAPIDKAEVRRAQDELHNLITSKQRRDAEGTSMNSARRQGKMQRRLARKKEANAVEQTAEALGGLNMDAEDAEDMNRAADQLGEIQIKNRAKKPRKDASAPESMDF